MYYFCLKDETSYPVPEEVLTEKDIPVERLADDAYLAVDPVSLQTLARSQASAGPETFIAPERQAEEISLPLEGSSRFRISVPKEEMMGYAGRVSGTPMAVIAVLMAKAVQKGISG